MDHTIYISELLYDHDCVIIPGFGGFIGNYSPARLQVSLHTFSPPYKSLLFNPNLRQNDGLLAVRISRGEKISYESALLSIKSFVSEWNKQLNSGVPVRIENIGILAKDKEGTLQFEQDREINFLADSYGLSSFISPAITRHSDRRSEEKKMRRLVESQEENRDVIPKVLKWAAFLALPIGTAALFGISNLEKIKSISVAYSGLLFSSPSSEIIKTPPRPKPVFILKKEMQPVSVVSEKEVKKEQAAIAKPTEKPYMIIVGAFRFLENAESLVSELKGKGYDAAMVGQTKTGLYRVSLQSFSEKNDAIKQLAMTRSGKFSSAWLLVK